LIKAAKSYRSVWL